MGLQTEVRAGHEETLLVFVKAPRNILGTAVYNSRYVLSLSLSSPPLFFAGSRLTHNLPHSVKDWLYGVVQNHPGENKVVDGAYEAEDILSVYHLVNWPKSNGGAGITPGWGQWENVECIFPLHNEVANLSLLKHLSSRLILTADDLDQIRNLFGTKVSPTPSYLTWSPFATHPQPRKLTLLIQKVAFYFAFIQTYVVFLTFPAATGLVAWLFFSKYSLTYAILTSVWCTVFLEYWKVQQVDLSIRWDVRGIGVVKVTRPQFRWEKELVDPSGRVIHYFPPWKKVARQLLQIPFMVFSTVVLGAVIIAVFALETLISDGYEGPYKSFIVRSWDPLAPEESAH